MSLHRIAPVLALAGLCACDHGQLTAPEHELPENAGRSLALPGATSPDARLIWTGGGEVITQASLEGGGTGVVAVRPSDGRVRLPAVPPPQPASAYYAGYDATESGTVYVVRGEGAVTSPDFVLYRATTGGLAERLDGALRGGASSSLNADGLPVVAAPGERALAYVRMPDSLVVLTPSTGERRIVAAGCRAVVAISPDGGRVLCMADRATRSYSVVNVADGARSPVPLPGVDANATLLFWFGDDGLRVVVSSNLDVAVRNLTTGVVTRVWAHDPGISIFAQPLVEDFSLTWSADGRQVAFWTAECLSGIEVTTCGHGQSVLQVFDLSEQRLHRAAVLKDTRVSRLALSPDGHEVAYSLPGGGLYVSAIP